MFIEHLVHARHCAQCFICGLYHKSSSGKEWLFLDKEIKAPRALDLTRVSGFNNFKSQVTKACSWCGIYLCVCRMG